MGFGLAVLLVAVGAVLHWAIHVSTGGAIDYNLIGVILMWAGVAVFVFTAILYAVVRREIDHNFIDRHF